MFEHPRHSYTKDLINAHMLQKNNKKQRYFAAGRKNQSNFSLEENLWGRVLEQLNAVDNVSFLWPKEQPWELSENPVPGKTTLGSAIAGLNGYRERYYLKILKYNRLHLKERQKLCKDIQVVFQDPYNSS